MHEELQLALMDTLLPERLFVILDALKALNEIGLSSVEDELQAIFGLQDGISDDDLFVARIEDCFHLALDSAISEFGIRTVDETSMAIKTALLRTVGTFEYYLIPQTLADLTHDDEASNEEIVASLVPLFTEVDEIEALDHLDYVGDATIHRMQVVANELVSLVPEEPLPIDNHDLRVRRINQILNKMDELDSTTTKSVLEISRGGVSMGQSLEGLLSIAYEDLEPLRASSWAYELLGLTYYSNTPIDEVFPKAQHLVSELTEDPDEIRRYRIELHRLYNDVSNVLETSL